MVQRLLQNGNRCRKSLRHGSSLRHYKICAVILHLDQVIAASIIIYGKLLRIGKLHAALRLHIVPDWRSRHCTAGLSGTCLLQFNVRTIRTLGC